MLGYRSIFRVNSVVSGRDLHNEALAQVHSWLRSGPRRLDADAMQEGITYFPNDVRTLLLRREAQDGTTTTRFRLSEAKTDGLWITNLQVRTGPREPDSVLVEVTDPRPLDDGDEFSKWTGVPGLARLILGSVNAVDGNMPLLGEPRLLRIDDLDEVYYPVLLDPERRSIAITAGTEYGTNIDEWRKHVDRLTRDTTGQASVFILDPELTQAVTALMPDHAPPIGGLRVLFPDTDPAVSARLQGNIAIWPRRIEDRGDHRVARHLGWLARHHQARNPLPPGILRAMRVMDDFERNQFISTWTSERPTLPTRVAPEVKARQDNVIETLLRDSDKQDFEVHQASAAEHLPADISRVLANLRSAVEEHVGDGFTLEQGLEFIVELVREYEGIETKLKAAVAYGNDATAQVTHLRDELDYAMLLSEELQQDLSELEQRLGDADDRNRYLQRKLAESDPIAAFSPTPQEDITQLPTDFDELLDLIPRLPNVTFVGDTEVVRALNDLTGRSNTASKAFRVLLCLNDYAQRKLDGTLTGGVVAHLESSTSAYGWSKNRHAEHESQDVKNQFRSQRTFAIPDLPDLGPVYMEAHFKISNEGTVAPRVHYFDATHFNGRVYVGYIGRHLRTKQTN